MVLCRALTALFSSNFLYQSKPVMPTTRKGVRKPVYALASSSFTGKSSSVITGTLSHPLSGAVARTITFEIKTSSKKMYSCILSTGSPSSKAAFNVVSYASKGKCIGLMGYAHDFYPKSCSYTINDGKWHSVRVLYDGSTLSIFIDGKRQHQVSKTYSTSSSRTIYVGKSNQVRHQNYFTGSIRRLYICSGAGTCVPGMLLCNGALRPEM